MRTKTLLLTAALSAAGVATSMAQVFSVNAVGYVNTVVPAKGLALISNPLDAGANNNVSALFTDAAKAAGGLQVYKFIPGPAPTYKIFSYDAEFGEWDRADAATETVEPGGGVFVRNPSANPVTITFVGEVKQGTTPPLSTPLPQGLSIVSSQVPQEGTLTALGYVPSGADQVYQFDTATQGYYIASYDPEFQEFDKPLKALKVGEAVFLRSAVASTWTRSFSVNQ
jgi:hypothetical protein